MHNYKLHTCRIFPAGLRFWSRVPQAYKQTAHNFHISWEGGILVGSTLGLVWVWYLSIGGNSKVNIQILFIQKVLFFNLIVFVVYLKLISSNSRHPPPLFFLFLITFLYYPPSLTYFSSSYASSLSSLSFVFSWFLIILVLISHSLSRFFFVKKMFTLKKKLLEN